jgi:hypothetical protein
MCLPLRTIRRAGRILMTCASREASPVTSHR